MRSFGQKIIGLALVLALAAGTLTVNGFAAEYAVDNPAKAGTSANMTAASEDTASKPSSEVIQGTYEFWSVGSKLNAKNSMQRQDSFVYRDDCFTRPSSEEYTPLRLLSSQVAAASTSRYPDGDRFYEKNDQNYNNVDNMLRNMGFQHVDHNVYFTKEKLLNTIGVAVGHRTIRTAEKEYTLLAIAPRSNGYKQEWGGNADIGNEKIHTGFKAGRDEVLRFVKQYVAKNNITGDVKIWIAGHSRGGAVANLLGGFFAGGGIDYFDGQLSVTPEDVYCYTFAAPSTIVNGADKKKALSVEGKRSGDYARWDTEGAAYTYSGSGAINVEDSEYQGIHNFSHGGDLVTMMPPQAWGYKLYGSLRPMAAIGTDSDAVSVAAMLKQLKTLEPSIYDQYVNGGDPRDFEEKTIDLANMKIVTKKNGKKGQEEWDQFLIKRTTGLVKEIPSDNVYVSGRAQDTMTALGGLYGMLVEPLPAQQDVSTDMVKPLVFSYLAYASECLQKEGRAKNDAEAVSIAVADLLKVTTGAKLDPENCTVDDFVYAVTKYIADHPKAPLTKKILDVSEKMIPADMASLAKSLLGKFYPNYDKTVTLRQVIFATLKACAYGADPKSTAYNDKSLSTPAGVRKSLYGMLPFIIGDKIDVSAVIGSDGKKPLSGLVGAVLPLVLTDTNSEGEEVTYATLDQAADATLDKALTEVFQYYYDYIATNHLYRNSDYNESYLQMAQNHETILRENIHQLRRIMTALLFSSENRFNTEANITSVATMAGNRGLIAPAHYDQVYIAWAKAAVLVDPSLQNTITVTPTSKKIPYSSLKKGSKSFQLRATAKDPTKITFKLKKVPAKAKKYISVTSKGKVTVKKGLGKGTYGIQVSVTAAATAKYNKTTAVKTVKINVR